ncbi:MAG TPA: acetate--CoA ligase family protein [Burkholderiales bacterium]|nr:acetate--CoA ligase family protein [Burkholderiales bacterium]
MGASDKIGPGFNAWNALQHVGFGGKVYLVNPTKTELLGQKCYPSLDAIDGDIDAAFVAVKAENVLEVARQAAAKKAGGIAILSSGFGDAGPQGLELQNELAAFAAKSDLSICGPNCLGLINFAGKTALFGTSLPDHVKRGGIAAVVQSGSIGIALLNSARGLGLSHMITSGNEAVTATADYLEALIDDPAVKAVIVFAEQIRKPAKFMAMTRTAANAGKPVIVLKSGRSDKGQAAVMAHTGAVAGSVEACDAALAASGAIQVFTLDELLETAALVSQVKTRPTARAIGALSLSGGEIALALDAAEENGIAFAPLAEAAAKIKPLMPEFSHLNNPLDLTWVGLYDPKVAEQCAKAMGELNEVGALVLLQDAPTGLGAQQAARYATLLSAVARGAGAAGKPLIALSNLSDEPHPELARVARETGTPYLRGTREGLAAIARYARWALEDFNRKAPASRPGEKESAAKLLRSMGSDSIDHRAQSSLTPLIRAADALAEHEARAILASYGIAGPQEKYVTSADDAANAAAAIGFPVVLKGIVPGMLHKTEAGLVKLRLPDAQSVRDAAATMNAPGYLVQQMISSVAELLVGARVDPDFGPLIVVGAGGVNVELYKDVAVRLAPISEEEALAAIAATRASKLLGGWRGAKPADVAAAAKTVSALSRFIADFESEVSEIEINPLAVLEEGSGCVALDAVIVRASTLAGRMI